MTADVVPAAVASIPEGKIEKPEVVEQPAEPKIDASNTGTAKRKGKKSVKH